MRITDGMLIADALLEQSRDSQALAQVSQESASGNMINEPSDDPTGFGSVVSMDSRLTIMQGYSTIASTAANNVDVASDALQSATDVLEQAKQIALVASSGTDDATSRANAAQEVTGLIQQMITLGNTQGPNGYVFGGTSTTAPPFDATGAFTGNNGVTQVAVANGVLVNSNVSGADAFTSAGGGSNVIADLQTLATALTNNDVPGITAGIGQMATDQSQVTAVMVQAGADSANLQSNVTLLTSLTTATETARAAIDNAATPEVYSELQSTQTAYQTALSVTQQILSLQSFSGSAV